MAATKLGHTNLREKLRYWDLFPTDPPITEIGLALKVKSLPVHRAVAMQRLMAVDPVTTSIVSASRLANRDILAKILGEDAIKVDLTKIHSKLTHSGTGKNGKAS